MNETNTSVYLPDCWDDDIRMNSLFSAFRPYSVNPQGWTDKMTFWKMLIMEYCNKKKTVAFSYSDLCFIFERKGRRPQCLHSVLEEMRREGTLLSLKDFTSRECNQSVLRWGYDVLVKRPLSWGWSYVQNAMIGKSETDEAFINVPVVKELASNVLRKHKQLMASHVIGSAILITNFYEHCKDICPDYSAFKFVLMQLQQDGEIKIFNEDTGQVIKFKENANDEIKPASEADMVTFRLQKARDILEEEVKQLEFEVNRCAEGAVAAVSQGSRAKATTFLKRKKRIEILLQKKIGCLENVESLQIKLQETQSGKLVLSTYQAATQALKQILDKNLSLAKLDTTLDDLEEVLDANAEVEDVLSRPITAHFDPDITELEAELQEILKEDNVSPEKHKEIPSSTTTTSATVLNSYETEKDLPFDDKARSSSSRVQPAKVAQPSM